MDPFCIYILDIEELARACNTSIYIYIYRVCQKKMGQICGDRIYWSIFSKFSDINIIVITHPTTQKNRKKWKIYHFSNMSIFTCIIALLYILCVDTSKYATIHDLAINI